MERCEGLYRKENRRCERIATHDMRGVDGNYYLVCEHHARENARSTVAQWSGQSERRRSAPTPLIPSDALGF